MSPPSEAASARGGAGDWETGVEEFGVLAAALALTVAVTLHLRSPAAQALGSGGPVEGVWLVSDSLERPARTESVWLRYHPGRGLLEMVSVPPGTRLEPGNRRRLAGREYRERLAGAGRREASAQAAAAVGGLFAGSGAAPGSRKRSAGEDAAIGAERSGAAQAPFFLHLEETAAARLDRSGGPDPADDAVVGVDPGLRKALTRLKGALASPAGPWGAARFLASRESAGETGLTRYDWLVLALEATGLAGGRVRPAELPVTARGEVLAGNLKALLAGEPPRERPILVEVLNAGAEPGAAMRVTRLLRSRGVDVVYFGNHGRTLQRTWVVDRSGDREAAAELTRLVPAPRVEGWTILSPERLVHASILLGADLAPGGGD